MVVHRFSLYRMLVGLASPEIASVGILIVVLFLATVISTGTDALAEEQERGATKINTHFDIRSQPLADALIAYASTTGVEIFVEEALTAGQTSSALKGTYDVETALSGILTGTGLEFRRAADHAFTIVASPAQEFSADRVPEWSRNSEHRRFLAALQYGVRLALCGRRETSPGHYRAALAIWTDPMGVIVSARVLGASDGKTIAASIAEGLKRVSVGMPTPASLGQPVVLVVLPRSDNRGGECSSRHAGRG